ncbi:MAG TPA: hypothetical protein PLI18_20120 [Pirellulaceae bacterium]|nr:hypothetical protein [Pirellulaceae bacterium]
MSTDATNRSIDAPLWYRLAPRSYRRAWRRLDLQAVKARGPLDDDASLAAAAGSSAVDRRAFSVGLRALTVGLIACSLVAVVASVDLDGFVRDDRSESLSSSSTVHRRWLELGTLIAAPLLATLSLARTRSIQLRQRRRRIAMLIEPASIPTAERDSVASGSAPMRSPAEVLLVASQHEQLTESTIRDLNGWQDRALLGVLALLAAATVLAPWVDMMRAAGSLE